MFGSILADDDPQIFPSGRTSRSVGPGIELQENPAKRKWQPEDLDSLAALD